MTRAASPGRQSGGRGLLALTVCALLGGCLGEGGLPGVAMLASTRPSDPAVTSDGRGEITRAAADRGTRSEQRSAVIDDLTGRRSVLPASGAFAEVAEAVLTSSKGAAAAELRVARLKAEAKARNWLPSIGPSVDLSSLGSIVAGILVEQVLLDNGRKKAERAFAAADVEVAAVTLAGDLNARVHDGLARFVEAEKARAQGALTDRALARMGEYDRIMRGRVEGGLADRSEARILAQKLSELRATRTADHEAETTALAELASLTGRPMDALRGLTVLQDAPRGATPLSVLRAEGEGRRMVAEAQMERAGHLPGVSARATVSGDGVKGGLRLGADKLLGMGTGASLQALEATETLADQRAVEAREAADRRLVALERQIAQLASREAEGAGVLSQTEASLKLFADQYAVGRRPLMELVNSFEAFARMEREQSGLRYDVALLRLRMALERGVLVDGTRM